MAAGPVLGRHLLDSIPARVALFCGLGPLRHFANLCGSDLKRRTNLLGSASVVDVGAWLSLVERLLWETAAVAG